MRRGLLALALLLILTPSAFADGDPASDVLLVKNVFLPYPAPSAAASNEIAAAVSSAYARGYRVKVAVIATETDLGSVPSLFNRPGNTRKRMAVRDSKTRVIAAWSTKLRTADPRKTYFVAWRVPPNVENKGLKFSIAAYDRTGNYTAPSCAPVAVKR